MKELCIRGLFATLAGLLTLASISCEVRAESPVPTNVILITLDGLRLQEVFSGADLRLIDKDNGVDNPESLKASYWRDERTLRRELLLPFLWNQCGGQSGWIAGDVENESNVVVTNGLNFSYPGYSEILCGRADERITSNDKKYNESVTVLEWLHNKPEFFGKIAVYGSWDVFPYIVNDQRSGIPVNAGWHSFAVGNVDRVATLNLVSEQLFHQWEGVRYDVLTASGAVEEMKSTQPRVLYVALGETDDWAHAGRYDRYLESAHQNDLFIKELWDTAQSLAAYRDKTLFIVTTDHGRGDGREGWKNHGAQMPGSDRIWIAAFGVGLCTTGIDRAGSYRQSQIAASLAAHLGFSYALDNVEVDGVLPISDCALSSAMQR